MPDPQLYFNGINGATGEYLVPPMTFEEMADLVVGEEQDAGIVSFLRSWWRRISRPYEGVVFGVDPLDLTQARWGIIFHPDESQAVRDALAPLIAHRQGRVLDYQPGETKDLWLARHGAGPGSVDPEKVPYYLLIVGQPERIPFSFQYLLDVQHAVGRLCFDTPQEYARYVQSVIDYETGVSVPNAKEMAFFATRHTDDPATRLSADLLARPLADEVPGRYGYTARQLWGADARKANLGDLLTTTGGVPPALLFTATHGMGFPEGDPRQFAAQGALLCQDWPGVGYINEKQYFSGADLDPQARVHGTVVFSFACFGAGTPHKDDFAHGPGMVPPDVAPRPFVAELPKRLLAHPQGGALAMIGHVERAWGYSFVWGQAGAQLNVFKDALGKMLAGWTVGHAMEGFNQRYAEISTVLSEELERVPFGQPVAPQDLAGWWTARNDARNYIIVGDPAVRLRVALLGESSATSAHISLPSDVSPPEGESEAAGATEGFSIVESPSEADEPSLPEADTVEETVDSDTATDGLTLPVVNVFVVGAGLMGGGIAQVVATAGYQVTMRDVHQEALDHAMEDITWSLGKFVEKERITAEDRDAALAHITPTLEMDAAAEADLVIEAVFEDIAVKHEVFRELDRLCPPHAILASNTSAIPITELARVTGRPERVIGTHFFSPVPLMRLCEVVRGLATSDETLETTLAFVHSLGKETITVRRDVAGFAMNRINLPATVEAIRLVEAGICTPEDIDRGMRLGMGRAMGPFETMDMTGLDVILGAMLAVYAETKDPRFWPPDLLRRKVALGHLGRKTGRGWYEYDGGS